MKPLPRPPFKTKIGRPIDAGIAGAVRILWENGIETTQSCEGGDGHPYPEPTVEFCGGHAEGFRALGIALQHGLRVSALRREWSVQDGEPVGPQWVLTFFDSEALRDPPKSRQGGMTWKWGGRGVSRVLR